MWNDSDYGVYGQGDDGYIRYSQAMDLIREQEESRKALMDEFDSDYNSEDHDYGNCHSSKMISDKSYTSITPKKDSLHEKAHQDYVLAVILLICSIFLIVICLLPEYSAYPADSGSTPAAVTTPKRICVRKDCDREAYKDFLSCSLHCPRQPSGNSSADKNKKRICVKYDCSKEATLGCAYCKQDCPYPTCPHNSKPSYSGSYSSKQVHDAYDDGYDDLYYDGDYDEDRYDNDLDYATGVDDAMDDLDW